MSWHVLLRTALGNLFALSCLLQTTSFCELADLPALCPVVRWIYIVSIVYMCFGSWSQVRYTLLHQQANVLLDLHCDSTCPNLRWSRWLYALYLVENAEETHKYACQ
jgi:hypothetical protein